MMASHLQEVNAFRVFFQRISAHSIVPRANHINKEQSCNNFNRFRLFCLDPGLSAPSLIIISVSSFPGSPPLQLPSFPDGSMSSPHAVYLLEPHSVTCLERYDWRFVLFHERHPEPVRENRLGDIHGLAEYRSQEKEYKK